jgi:hypothetical protein
MFSLRTIRILLEKNNIPFEVQSSNTPGLAAKGPVAQAAAKSGPNIVALVDRFSDLPKELQSYLLSVGDVSGDSPDRVRSLVIGGRGGGRARAEAGGGGQASAAPRAKKGAAKSRKAAKGRKSAR